ncbi:sensor histidine kinase [Massilia sp. YIM B02769]|uniref:sensor histidine kinase n=1 Tax=Massilia sp. YIM B02769 TaxID=3050129 RepID=UPI0025B6D630|nr:sensor histidine kinase [Massilia sp. YIM B02769]MDN4060144.1 sensor histidine kinase [Massilia sp. YIM B02769]
MSSIRLRLLKWLVGPILVFNLGAAALTYLLAWTPAQLAFDDGLRAAASALAGRVRAEGLAPLTSGRAPDDGAGETGWTALHASDGRLLAGSAALPAPAGPGLRDARIQGEPVRIAVVALDFQGGTAQVSVARTVRARGQVRSAIVRSLVLLEGVFSLALIGLVWFSVGNGLAPLARLRARLDARGSADLAPLDDSGMPRELAPVVDAFNALLGRIEAGARAQDEFRANVAHQLRTPLAGLKLQLEWLAARHALDPDSARSLGLMLQANERMIRQTNQLLSLERAEPNRFARARLLPVDLAQLVAESIQHFVEQAAAKDIDLGFELDGAPLQGDRFLLRDLVDNLVDNALRYTPAGGRVTVACGALGDGGSFLRIEDNGPGIPAHLRPRVFERFVRLDEQTTGSGLGLAIVRDIANLHAADLVLGQPAAGSGAVFTLHFP